MNELDAFIFQASVSISHIRYRIVSNDYLRATIEVSCLTLLLHDYVDVLPYPDSW